MLNMRKLSPALAKKAVEELNEDPERTASAVEILRDWMMKQPHLKARTDDQFLTSFLRGCKFSIERAKKKIDLYYTVKTALPEWFEDRDLCNPQMVKAGNAGLYFTLPSNPESDLPAIYVFRSGLEDPYNVTVNDMFKFASLVNEIAFCEDDNLAVSGCHFFIDLTGMTVGHILQFDPITLKKIIVLYQDASPFRMKGFHFYNMPPVVEPVVHLFRSLLNEKLKNRIFIYGKNALNKISEQFPRSALPNEYGGNAGKSEDFVAACMQNIASRKEFLDEEKTFGVNENLRPGKPKNFGTLFGVDGTFRKLNVD